MAKSWVYRWLDAVAARGLPARCLLCAGLGQAPGFDLCAACDAELPRIERPCPRCGLAMTGHAVPDPDGPAHCAACTARRPVHARCLAPFAYEFPLTELIPALKYHGALANARVLGTLLGRAAVQGGWLRGVDLVVPLPLHPSRLAERGFNQSLELAMVVADRCGLVLESRVLQRCRATRPQVGLSRELRLDNVRGAFMADSGRVVGRHIVLVDDVVTTGSTVAAAAQGLRHAGARRVDVWCIARAPG